MPDERTQHREHAEVLAAVCAAVTNHQRSKAAALISNEYPFIPLAKVGRRYSIDELLGVFLRDGFIDRYSGERLINPGVLRAISSLFPDAFPYHSSWKHSETHIAFWELFPTLDHIVPVARGGLDQETNWVTTNMLRNSAKSNALLSEIEWSLHPAGDPNKWDGMTRWLIEFTDGGLATSARLGAKCPHSSYVTKWARASVRAIGSA